jgi:membrane-bound serine protease (ClpP class)
VLLLAAFVFFIIDLHVPGHGLPTIAGVTCFVLGGLFLYDGSVPSARVSRPLIVVLAVLIGAFFFFALRAALKARKAPPITGPQMIVGAEGVVTRALDPTGEVRVRGETWTATPSDEHVATLPVGAPVRVVGLRGLTLQVEAVVQQSDRADHIDQGV